jgi:hypothetical protein
VEVGHCDVVATGGAAAAEVGTLHHTPHLLLVSAGQQSRQQQRYAYCVCVTGLPHSLPAAVLTAALRRVAAADCGIQGRDVSGERCVTMLTSKIVR